jgi:hypothetical protein
LLKEKCPWHLDDNHTTEQCYQLRRALKDTPEPWHPHDKKGKKKTDEGNDDFQEPDKTVKVLFGGLLLTVQNRSQVHRKPTGDLVPFSPRRVLPRFVNPRIGSKLLGFSI